MQHLLFTFFRAWNIFDTTPVFHFLLSLKPIQHGWSLKKMKNKCDSFVFSLFLRTFES